MAYASSESKNDTSSSGNVFVNSAGTVVAVVVGLVAIVMALALATGGRKKRKP